MNLIARESNMEKQEGFSKLSTTPRSNTSAVAMVDDRLSWLWLRRGWSGPKGKRQDREKSERAREWETWCASKLDGDYEGSLNRLTIERINEFSTASLAARRKSKRRESSWVEQPGHEVRRSGNRRRSIVSGKKLQSTERWTNAHVLALELTSAIWREYEREREERQEEARRFELVDLIQGIAPEVVRVGEERIRHGLQGRTVPRFRALAATPKENKVAINALDECISVVFRENVSASTSSEEQNELLKRWRAFCPRKSTKRGEEGLTHGQAVAWAVAVQVLRRRWRKGAVTEALLRAVKDRIVSGVENEIPVERGETPGGRRSNGSMAIGE